MQFAASDLDLNYFQNSFCGTLPTGHDVESTLVEYLFNVVRLFLEAEFSYGWYIQNYNFSNTYTEMY